MDACVRSVEGTRFKAGSGDVRLVLGCTSCAWSQSCCCWVAVSLRHVECAEVRPRRVLEPFRVGLQVHVLCAARGFAFRETSSRC